jgi:hypothetical protein
VRWIELATKDGQLAQSIERLGNSPAQRRLAAIDLKAAQDVLKKEISDAYSIAKDQLLSENPDLQELQRDLKRLQAEEGQFKR